MNTGNIKSTLPYSTLHFSRNFLKLHLNLLRSAGEIYTFYYQLAKLTCYHFQPLFSYGSTSLTVLDQSQAKLFSFKLTGWSCSCFLLAVEGA